MLKHSDSLFDEKACHGVGPSHEQHHLSVEIHKERPQKTTRDPGQSLRDVVNVIVVLY